MLYMEHISNNKIFNYPAWRCSITLLTHSWPTMVKPWIRVRVYVVRAEIYTARLGSNPYPPNTNAATNWATWLLAMDPVQNHAITSIPKVYLSEPIEDFKLNKICKLYKYLPRVFFIRQQSFLMISFWSVRAQICCFMKRLSFCKFT